MIDRYSGHLAAALAAIVLLAPIAAGQTLTAQCEAAAVNPDCGCVTGLVADTPSALQPEASAFLSMLLGAGSMPPPEAMAALAPEMDRLSDGYSRCLAGARAAARRAAEAESAGFADAAASARELERPIPPAEPARRARAFDDAARMCANSSLPLDCTCLIGRLDAAGPQAGALELDYMLLTLTSVLHVDGPVGPDDLTARQQLRVQAVESPYADGFHEPVTACAIPDPQGLAAAEAAADGTLSDRGPAARIRAQCRGFGNSPQRCACEVELMERQMGGPVFAVYGAEGDIGAIAAALGISESEARQRRAAANAVLNDRELSDTRRLACVAVD